MHTLVQVVYWAAFAAFAGFQTAILLERGFTSGQAGVFASIRNFSGIIAQPLLGGWADRHPEVSLNRILGSCLAGGVAVSIVFCLTRPGFWGTALMILILGALELNAYPLLDSLVVQFMNVGMDVKYSLGRGLGSFAYAVTCVVLGWQTARLGMESALTVHTVLLLALLAVALCFPRLPRSLGRSRAEAKEQPHSIWYLLRLSPSFTLMLGACFFGIMAGIPAVSFMINLVTERGGDSSSMGLALFLMAASELPAAFLFQRLRCRMNSRSIMLIAVTFMALKPLALLLTPDLGWLLAVQPLQMLGYGLFTPASVYYADSHVSDVDRVKVQSLMMVASNGLGGVAGNLLGGIMMDLGGTRLMLLAGIACGAAAILLAILSLRCPDGKETAA